MATTLYPGSHHALHHHHDGKYVLLLPSLPYAMCRDSNVHIPTIRRGGYPDTLDMGVHHHPGGLPRHPESLEVSILAMVVTLWRRPSGGSHPLILALTT